MMIGVIGAILYNQQNKLFLKVFSNKFLQLLAWFFYFVVGLAVIHSPVFVITSYSIHYTKLYEIDMFSLNRLNRLN